MLDQLRSRLIAANFTAVQFTIFSPGDDLTLEELRQAARSVPVFPAPHPQSPWGRLLEGQQNNILVIDSSCPGGGRLTYQVIMPWSMLHYPYVKAAILSTYNDNPCGPCLPDTQVTTNNKLDKTEKRNITHVTSPQNTQHNSSRTKLTSIVNQYRPIASNQDGGHSTTAKPSKHLAHNNTHKDDRQHHVGGWVKGIQNNALKQHRGGHSNVIEGPIIGHGTSESKTQEEYRSVKEGKMNGNRTAESKSRDSGEDKHQKEHHGVKQERIIGNGTESKTKDKGEKKHQKVKEGEIIGNSTDENKTKDISDDDVSERLPETNCNELDGGSNEEYGCFDPAVTLAPLRELPDGTFPIRVIMHSPHRHKGDKKRYEYLELQIGNPGYHGHLDEGGRRIEGEDSKVLVEHLKNGSKDEVRGENGGNKTETKEKVVKKDKTKTKPTNVKTLQDLNFKLMNKDDIMYDRHSDDAAYDHHVDEYNDALGDASSGDASAPRKIPWEDMESEGEAPIVKYKPGNAEEEQLLKTYKELVPGYDGRKLETDEETRKEVEETLEDEGRDWSDMTISEGRSDKGDSNKESSKVDYSWGTKEIVEKKKKVIRPVTYDSDSDSSSRGEMFSREMATAHSTEENVSASNSEDKDTTRKSSKVEKGKEETDKKDNHRTMKKKLHSAHALPVNDRILKHKDMTHMASNEDVGQEDTENKNNDHRTLKKKLQSNDDKEENVMSNSATREKSTGNVTSEEKGTLPRKTASDESMSVKEVLEDEGMYESLYDRGPTSASSVEKNLPHDSLKKKAVHEEEQDKVVAHYSKLLPWVNYHI